MLTIYFTSKPINQFLLPYPSLSLEKFVLVKLYIFTCLPAYFLSLSLHYKLEEREALSVLFTMVFQCLEQDVLILGTQ